MFRQLIIAATLSLLTTGIGYASEIRTSFNGPIILNSLAATIALVQSANLGDTVVIYADSKGGRRDEGDKLMEAVQTTKAGRVTMVVTTDCSSMCNYIAAKVTEVDLKGSSRWIFHLGQSTDTATNKTTIVSIYSKDSYIRDLATKTLKEIKNDWGPLLSEEEYGRISNGMDVELNGLTLYARSTRVGYAGPVIKLFSL